MNRNIKLTIISGGQNGVDIGALKSAKNLSFKTGGMMPKTFLTLDGPRPDYEKLYNLKEHKKSTLYPPRTEYNIKNSDGTLKITYDNKSRGERCTQKYIDRYKKPYFHVDLNNLYDNYKKTIMEVVNFIKKHKIKTLNVAGNTENRFTGIEDKAYKILNDLLLNFL